MDALFKQRHLKKYRVIKPLKSERLVNNEYIQMVNHILNDGAQAQKKSKLTAKQINRILEESKNRED